MTLKMIRTRAMALSKQQRIDLALALWDSIEPDPKQVSLSEGERRMLEQRVKRAKRDPGAVCSRKSVMKAIDQAIMNQ